MVSGKAYLRVMTIHYYQEQIMIMSYSSAELKEGIGELQDYVLGIAIL